jgi:hypothetical protein
MIDYKFEGKLYRFPDDFFVGIPESQQYEYVASRMDLDEYEVSDGVKFDNGKPRWGLLPYDQLEQVVDILTFGAKKYKDDNWKVVDAGKERYFDAMMRHIKEYRAAKERNDTTLKFDDESGKNHLAHVICNALFLMWFDDQEEQDVKVETAIFGKLDDIQLEVEPKENEFSDLIEYCEIQVMDFIEGFGGDVVEDVDLFNFISQLKCPDDKYVFKPGHLKITGDLNVVIADKKGNHIYDFNIDLMEKNKFRCWNSSKVLVDAL